MATTIDTATEVRFTPAAAKRIAKAVRAVERPPGSTLGPRTAAPIRSIDDYWVHVTATEADDDGYYPGVRLDLNRDTGDWEEFEDVLVKAVGGVPSAEEGVHYRGRRHFELDVDVEGDTVRRTVYSIKVGDAGEEYIFANITQSANVSGLVTYGGIQLTPIKTPGVFNATVGGLTLKPWSNPLKEYNSNPGVANGTKVQAWRGASVEPTGNVTIVVNGNGTTNSIQHAWLNHAGGGYFQLVYNDNGTLHTTGNIALGASAATVETALEDLPPLTDVIVSGNGWVGDPYNVTFQDSYSNVSLMAFDLSNSTNSQEWYFKHQPNGTFSGNGTAVTVELTTYAGNDTWNGLIVLTDGSNVTNGAAVKVLTKPHNSPLTGRSIYRQHQVLAGQLTNATISGTPVVLPQRNEIAANATREGLVDLEDQMLGAGIKAVEQLNIPTPDDTATKIMADGSGFLIDSLYTLNMTIGGVPTDVTAGSYFHLREDPGSYSMLIQVGYNVLPLQPPYNLIVCYDMSGSVGSGGPGVQIFKQGVGVSTEFGDIPNAYHSVNPLPGVVMLLGWVCGGQLNLKDVAYYGDTGTRPEYNNQTFGQILDDLRTRIDAMNGTLTNHQARFDASAPDQTIDTNVNANLTITSGLVTGVNP